MSSPLTSPSAAVRQNGDPTGTPQRGSNNKTYI